MEQGLEEDQSENSYKPYDPRRCCMNGCRSHLENSGTVTYHSFPKCKDSRKKWSDCVGIAPDKITAKKLVCSNHFQESDYFKRAAGDTRSKRILKRNAVPAPYIPNSPAQQVTKKSEPLLQKKMKYKPSLLKSRKKLDDDTASLALGQENTPTLGFPKSNLPTIDESWDENSMNQFRDHCDKESLNEPSVEPVYSLSLGVIKTEESLSESSNGPLFETQDVPIKIEPDTAPEEDSESVKNHYPLTVTKVHSVTDCSRSPVTNKYQHETCTQREILKMSIQTKEDLYACIGIDSELFVDLEKAVDYCESKTVIKKRTDTHNRIVICLAKLKLNLAYDRLGSMFSVSYTNCLTSFRYMITLLSKILRKMIYWPPNEKYFQNLPADPGDSKKILIGLIFIEIPVQEPDECSECRDSLRPLSLSPCTYSVKILLGIASTGLIIYVSEVFGGRASYYDILKRTSILSRLNPSKHVVMINKLDSEIEAECLRNGISLIKSLKIDECTTSQVTKGSNVLDMIGAKKCVENSLEKLKSYGILKDIIQPLLIAYVEDICVIIGALINIEISSKSYKELFSYEFNYDTCNRTEACT